MAKAVKKVSWRTLIAPVRRRSSMKTALSIVQSLRSNTRLRVPAGAPLPQQREKFSCGTGMR